MQFFGVTAAVEVVVVVAEVILSQTPRHPQRNLLVLPSPSVKNMQNL
jgi:hypothetical protein